MIYFYVINLKERTDRKERITNDFSKYSNIQLHFIDAIRHENGAIGCFQSHKKCIELAKQQNMEYIIVLEDDCLPMKNFEERLLEIKNYLENHLDIWDIFLGGVKKCNRLLYKIPLQQNHLYGIKKAHSTHFVIYNHSIYDKVLECDETKEAIDTFWHLKYRVLITLPFLAYQRNDYTDIGKCYNSTLINVYNKTQQYLLEFSQKNSIPLLS